MPSSGEDLRAQVRQFLESEKAFGAAEWPLPPGRAGLSRASDKKSLLSALEEEYRQCRLCGLCDSRTQVVFGSGNPEAKLMFVGEAPGFDEDRQGAPFVGAAGQLLTKIIEAMKLKRDEVYIANCLKCRPPQNRSPLPSEIVTCKPILMKQIEIIRPKIICALGKFAAQTLLETQEPISRLRGRFQTMGEIQVMPTFHPAYLLRNPADKKLVWDDVQKIMKEL
ncbi:MAG: uracil-DNA glycosylase, partial [Candidatus Omnitrophica bacterium]|nr:uracil-DNA glycosylase [Candidatus Omnitrophota bacterium]